MKIAYENLARLVAANNKSGEDDLLVLALCYKESGFDPDVVTKDPSSTAAGLMGVTRTAIREVNRVDGTALSYDQVRTAASNLEMGTRYLRIMIKRFGGRSAGLDRYGTGPGYSRSIAAAAAALAGAADPMGVLVREIGPR